MDPHPLYLPALQTIGEALRANTDRPIITAVDGRCGAGKTSFAAYCALYFAGCTTLHMDDFFLPPKKRTAERLATPGGNVDYERAEEELFIPLSQGREAVYRPFDCSAGAFGAPTTVPHTRLNIIEGTYALHPVLEKYAQVKLFFTCSPQVQLYRLTRREPPEKLETFRKKWIPLEETYFSAFGIENHCDVIIDTTCLSTEEKTV